MDWQLTLEYLRVILSVQMVVIIAAAFFVNIYKEQIRALFGRLVKVPGVAEFSTPQSEKITSKELSADKTLPEPSEPQSLPVIDKVDKATLEIVRQHFEAERARAYHWEYSYLNYFLVARTQQILDWIAGVTGPLSSLLFDTLWTPFIADAKERKAILTALESHHLIEIENDLIKITPKGNEYRNWVLRTKPPSST